MKNGFQLLIRSFREGFLQLWRHKFLSLSTIFLGALIIVLINFILGISYYADHSLQQLEKKADFMVALSDNYDVFDFEALQNELRNYPLQMQVYESEVVQEVPLPRRLYIRFQDLSVVGEVFQILKSSRYASLFGDWDGGGERDFVQVIDRLLSLRENLEKIAFWTTIIFLVGGVFLVINTFRMALFSRKDEIFIARLVGAQPSFITGPFLMEGVFIGFLSAFLGIFVFIFLLREVSFLPGGDIFLYLYNTVFSLQILLAGGVGVLGAFLAVRKYLFGRFEEGL